ncbi:MAG: ankyrin repeat domain-containing protein [Planctomycetes bacterium]|nr:ankyrin repeat domain-containing protein [Planctomycetota bacterium]
MRLRFAACVTTTLILGCFATPVSLADSDIFAAARVNDADRARAILSEKPALRDARDARQRTPLHAAAESLKPATAAVLLERGAAVDAVDAAGQTALHLAVFAGGESKEAKEARADLVRRLCEAGANVTLADREESLPLHLAAIKGRAEVLDLLLPKGAEADARDRSGRTALHYAALGGHAAVIRALIEHGASVAACDNAGETALHAAARRCREKAAELLLSSGADVNAKNTLGQTPLILAASQGPADPELDAAIAQFTKRLLAAGATRDVRDKEGRTALDYAVLREHPKTAALLREEGGRR